MITRNAVNLDITYELLAQLLRLPKGVKIISTHAYMPYNRFNVISLLLEGEMFSEVSEGSCVPKVNLMVEKANGCKITRLV